MVKYHLYLESKKTDTNKLICKTETHRLWKTYGYQSRQVGVGGRYGLGVWDWHMYPETYGMTDQWEHAI